MIERWFEELLALDFNIIHCPGVSNLLPDALSRFYDHDGPRQLNLPTAVMLSDLLVSAEPISCFLNANLPILSLYASKLYAYQGSSAESERAFSSAGRMKNSTRSQLKPETLAALVVLKSNGDLLDKKVSNFDSDDNSDFDIEQ